MMFLVRSTFWLGIVVSNMPLDRAEAPRVADWTQGAVAAGAASAVKEACARESASCRAILAAAGAGVALNPEGARGAPRAGAIGKARRPSANSLDAADLAAPWRGRPANSGA
jgi:hypothetical protein